MISGLASALLSVINYAKKRTEQAQDLIKKAIKLRRAHGGCLGARSRRRTQQAAKRFGEVQATYDPEISEWGNPLCDA